MAEKKADAVFEGGGVKGIGLVGAVAAIEKAGYEFENLAGTSAGAITAALLAAGYRAAEIKRELERLDYNDFKDEGWLDKLWLPGKALSLAFEYGIYEGQFFEEWIGGLLAAKGKTKFKDITTENKNEQYKYKAQFIATDLTDQRLLVLPRDLGKFGYDPDEFNIARAVRMSMSIPLFFEPVRVQDSKGQVHIIVDGGVLSNYPIWLLDDDTNNPPWPTFGFKLMEPGKGKEAFEGKARGPLTNLWSYFAALAGTMLDAHDRHHISQTRGDLQRTIGIRTVVELSEGKKEIKTTDFDITKEESEALYENGVRAASDFLKSWDFQEWVRLYRSRGPNGGPGGLGRGPQGAREKQRVELADRPAKKKEEEVPKPKEV